MTQSSIFYSETATDPRSYYSADYARFFRGIFGTAGGVVDSKLSEFAVSAQSPAAMAVNVASGWAWVYGKFVKSTATEAKTISAAHATLNRVDRIVLRNTTATGITIEVLTGTAAASPTIPPLTTTSVTYEISLARVYVGAGVTTIVAGNITDERTYATMQSVRQSALVHGSTLDLGSQKIADLGDGLVTTDAMTKMQFDTSGNFSLAPIGVVRAFPPSDVIYPGRVPLGFLRCDGSAVSRTTYAALFAVIGTTFGAGDGSTTFNLPEMRGYFVVGQKSTDADFDTVGETGGSETVTLTSDQIPAHTHSVEVGATSSSTGYDPSMIACAPPVTGAASGSTGGGGAHNNLPLYYAFTWGIRYE